MAEIKDFIEYIKNYKSNVKEMDELDRDLDNLKVRYGSIKKDNERLKKDIDFLNVRLEEHLETIKEKNKQLKELKKRNKKLIQIEEMFNNKKVVLKELKELVKGE